MFSFPTNTLSPFIFIAPIFTNDVIVPANVNVSLFVWITPLASGCYDLAKSNIISS